MRSLSSSHSQRSSRMRPAYVVVNAASAGGSIRILYLVAPAPQCPTPGYPLINDSNQGQCFRGNADNENPAYAGDKRAGPGRVGAPSRVTVKR